MVIREIVILRQFSEKLWSKHRISTDEVLDIFKNRPNYRKLEKGDINGEDLYGAYGRTESGRYLSVFFIYKLSHDALVISARDMDKKERRRYVKK